jgi:thiamine pyrophosphokinase
MARLIIEDRDRGSWAFHDDETGRPGLGPGVPGAAPRILVLAGGFPPPAARLRTERARADALVCADGGVRAAWAAGLAPDLVVGDLDSLPDGARERLPVGVIRHEPSAEDNDLEKALRAVYGRWGAAAEIVLLGAGPDQGRSDHALANLGVLLAEPHRRIQWVDAAGRMVALRDGRLTADDAVGAILSVLPWSAAGATVSEVGVHYPLDEEHLRLGGRGVSNEIGDETATVEVHAGAALVWIGV